MVSFFFLKSIEHNENNSTKMVEESFMKTKFLYRFLVLQFIFLHKFVFAEF